MTEQDSNFGTHPSLVDRAVLITGGGSGIGASMVSRLTTLGARVGFVDIDKVASNALTEEIKSQSPRHIPVYRAVDITDLDTLNRSIDEIRHDIGPIRGLVNNAANDTRHKIDDVTQESWRQAISVNLDHQFFAAQAVSQMMKQAGGGAIVNMGSMSWRIGLDQLSAYVTAKAGIEGLTHGLARELGPDDIRVNCITPGFIRTERQVKLWLNPELERIVMEGQCLKEFIDPVYVANLAAFLLSDDAKMCTSGIYPINAGWI